VDELMIKLTVAIGKRLQNLHPQVTHGQTVSNKCIDSGKGQATISGQTVSNKCIDSGKGQATI